MSEISNDNEGFTYEKDETVKNYLHRRATRRRSVESASDHARQERRRRAAIELEQVEKPHIEQLQVHSAQEYPAYGETPHDSYSQETYIPAPMQNEPVPGRPVSQIYNTPGYNQNQNTIPSEPIVPAYPAPKNKPMSVGRFQGTQNAQSTFPENPTSQYSVTNQQNEVVIDASMPVYDPELPNMVLPVNKEYGGRSEILYDEDDSFDEASSLAKGGRLQTKISTKRRKNRVGKRRYGVFLGSVVMLFALVGIVVTVYAVTNFIVRIASDDSALRAYDEMLAPVVGLDPEPFENIKGADPDMVLMSSILAVEYASTDQNEYSDFVNNVQNIPVSEILVQATNLFGPECNVRLQSIEDDINSYVYDEAKEVMVAPLFGNIGAYIGRTVSQHRSGDSTFLRVAYISSANWSENSPDGTEQDPDYSDVVVDKYMEYELKTDPETGRQYVFAIRALDEGDNNQSDDDTLQ